MTPEVLQYVKSPYKLEENTEKICFHEQVDLNMMQHTHAHAITYLINMDHFHVLVKDRLKSLWLASGI